jgi:hypothetical protein
VGASKRERIEEVCRRLTRLHPFEDGNAARSNMEDVIVAVEDEMSGIKENENADKSRATDGRMYPPHDKFEIKTGTDAVRGFKQLGHSTYFGKNGSIRISRSDGSVEFELQGKDGLTVGQLLKEKAL